MNQKKGECEKRENDACLREKRELDKKENTDVRERRMERKIKVKKNNCERTRQKRNTRGSGSGVR